MSNVTDRTHRKINIKSNWITARIGDVAKTQYGLSEGMNRDAKGYKIFRMGEVQDGRLIDTGNMKYADISATEFAQYRLQPNDVLFNRTNSFELVGKTGIFDLDGDYCFASYLIRLKLDRQTLLPQFLNYLMNSASFQRRIKGQASQSINQANINATILSNETIRFPQAIDDQRRIVRILDKAFEGIAAARVNAEKNLCQASSLLTRELESLISKRAKDWHPCALGSVVKFIDYRGRTPEKMEAGIPLITAKNVRMGYVKDEPREFVDPDSYEKWMTRGIPQFGDILFTTEAPLANVAQLETTERVVFAQRIIVMQPDPHRLDKTFLKFLLLSPPIQKLIHEKGTGATATGIKASLLKTIPIVFPSSVREQTALSEKLTALSCEAGRLAALYRNKIAAIDDLKQSLLHQAFSGNL